MKDSPAKIVFIASAIFFVLGQWPIAIGGLIAGTILYLCQKKEKTTMDSSKYYELEKFKAETERMKAETERMKTEAAKNNEKDL